jgi:hypothetical protein
VPDSLVIVVPDAALVLLIGRRRVAVIQINNRVAAASVPSDLPTLPPLGSVFKLASVSENILFTASDGVTKLNHELETYNSITGQAIAWVRIPTLSSNIGKLIKLDEPETLVWSIVMALRLVQDGL